jgi:dUTP pyrophosphatase
MPEGLMPEDARPENPGPGGVRPKDATSREAVVRCRPVRAGARLPERMTPGASGFDLHACLDAPLVIEPGGRALVATGLVLAIPPGFEGCLRARSGLALRHGIGLANGPGTIDSDYRGEVGVILVNWGSQGFTVEPGDRVAQMVIQELPQARMEWSEALPGTERGDGGFGHTGTAPVEGGS